MSGTFLTFLRGAAFGGLGVLLCEILLIYLILQWFLHRKRGPVTVPGNGQQHASHLQQSLDPQDPSKEKFYKDDEEGGAGHAGSFSKGMVREYALPWPEEVTARLTRWLTPSTLDDIAMDTGVMDQGGGGSGNNAGSSLGIVGTGPGTGGIAASTATTGNTGDASVDSATEGKGGGNGSSGAPSLQQKYPLPSAHTKTMDAEWLNIILSRMFLTLRSSQVFRNMWAKKVSNKMNMKLKGNSFISSIAITDLFLGECPPSLEGVRLLKGLSKELAVMGEVDILYRGGASICIETHLANGSIVPMQVFMNDLHGTLRVRLPSERWADMIGFAFVDDPGVTFRVESSLALMENQMLKSMVNGVLSTIMRKTFLELWVLPSWRSAFVPLLEPSLDDWLSREEDIKALETAKKQHKPTIASRATQLWESGQLGGNIQSLLKRPPVEKVKDCMENVLFPPTALLPTKSTHEIVNMFEGPLLTGISGLIAEQMDESGRARSISNRLKFSPIPPASSSSHPAGESANPSPALPHQQLQPITDSTTAGATISTNTPSAPTVQKEDDTIGGVGTSASWKEVKRKGDVSVQKKKVSDADGSFEITRAIMTISCDANRTFSILSNPLHFRHVYETFIGSKVLFEDGRNSVHACTFHVGKTEKKLTVFQTKGNPTEDGVKMVAMRSIGGIAGSSMGEDESVRESLAESETTVDAKPSSGTLRQRLGKKDGTSGSTAATDGTARTSTSTASLAIAAAGQSFSNTHSIKTQKSSTHFPLLSGHLPGAANESDPDYLYLFGYQVAKVGEATCTVSVISQFSGDLQRLDVDFAFCRKLKQFIEELAQLTDLDQQPVSQLDSSVKKFFNAEDLKVTSEKLASYLGTAKSYLRTSSFKAGLRSSSQEEIPGESALSETSGTISPPIVKSDFAASSSNLQAHSDHPSSEELANVPYAEITIPQKEVIKVEIPFIRQNFEQTVVFKWEYVSRSEHSLNFGIHFVPLEQENVNSYTKILPYAGADARILIPISNFQSYSRPSFGVIPLSDLQSGTIILVWENTHALKSNAKNIVYKTHFQGNSKSLPECQAVVSLARKSFVSLPFIFDSTLGSMVEKISIEFNTGAHVVPFALYFDELPSAGGSNQMSVRKTIISFGSSSKSGQIVHIVPVTNGNFGVYTLQWDNSQSLVSSRQIDFIVRLLKITTSA